MKHAIQETLAGTRTPDLAFPLHAQGGPCVVVTARPKPRYDVKGHAIGVIFAVIPTSIELPPTFELDPIGNVTKWGHHISLLSGLNQDDIVGTSFVHRFVPQRYQQVVSNVIQHALIGLAADIEFPLLAQDGTLIDVTLKATPRFVVGKLIVTAVTCAVSRQPQVSF